MKYIKLFEDLNQDGYEPSTHEEMIDMCRFTDASLDMIPGNEIEFSSEADTALFKLGFKSDNFRRKSRNVYILRKEVNRDGIREVNIIPAKDDWYFAQVDVGDESTGGYMVYYKCDQVDGLLNCLKKECDIS